MRISTVCSLVAAAAFAGVLSCGFEDISYPVVPGEEFVATLSGANEAPPVTTAATGTALFTVVNDTILTWRLDVADIDSTSAAHIHLGAAGVPGGVIVPLFSQTSACRQNVDTALTIDSSRVGNPATIKIAGRHRLTVASQPRIRIAGHAGSTPDLNGEHVATVTGDSTFTIPVNVTTAGTGGTAQRFNLINIGTPRCTVGFDGPLNQQQVKYSGLALDTTWGATRRARFDSLLVLMRNGGVYVNVHNPANPGGHIRGQIGPR